MLISRRCPFTGVMNFMEIDVTGVELADWHDGKLIQHAMPHISADEREFIMTGITPEQWAKTMGDADDE